MTPPHEQPERRRVQRIALSLDAWVREPGRSRLPVRVIDISTHGCRIEMLNGVFAGSAMWLSIATLEPQSCRIAWQRDGFAGIEFATPLSEAVLDSLVSVHAHASKATATELRDLALRTRRLAAQSFDSAAAQVLRELSRDCAVQAIIQEFGLIEGASEETLTPQLTGKMVRRTTSSPIVGPGFSFTF